uniref:CCHC-type domain-containing protein n=2 Tax=Nicotiana tabacum TaxID=4097 RepID=A0A1S4AES7_TOBAC|nr:PREDICTED: uncharacterized protein LOC107796885 [Nicotiana tabacum]
MMNSNYSYREKLIPAPPKPPDITHENTMVNGVEDKASFKEMLLASNPMNFTNSLTLSENPMEEILPEEGVQEHLIELNTRGIKAITLTEEEKQRIYEPWKFSLIVKLFGKRMLHHYLKKNIQELWRPTKFFSLIDLGDDYYIIKFTKRENMEKAFTHGPWFINGHYLSITKWRPNFVANKEKLTVSVVWIRLPQLPTEFYDGKLLEKIGNAIGRLLKIDVCTSTTVRGHYARLCVELPLETPVQPYIYIGQHKQYIHCKGEKFLCKNCGRLGHIQTQCNFIHKK